MAIGMHLHCTKKLIEQFGFSAADLNAIPPSDRLLAWHAHIVSIARSKTLVAVNDQTFYAVIMPQMNKKRFVRFEEEFRSALSAFLNSEGFPNHYLNALMGDRLFFRKSHDRQILGIINEIVKYIRYFVERRYGGWEHVQIEELTKEINRIPWLAGTPHCIFPIGKMTADLEGSSDFH